jgi:hypothetical protein
LSGTETYGIIYQFQVSRAFIMTQFHEYEEIVYLIITIFLAPESLPRLRFVATSPPGLSTLL